MDLLSSARVETGNLLCVKCHVRLCIKDISSTYFTVNISGLLLVSPILSLHHPAHNTFDFGAVLENLAGS